MKPISFLRAGASAALFLFVCGLAAARDAAPLPSPVKDPARVTLAGDWQIKVTYRGKEETFDIAPPETVHVVDEEYPTLDPFNASGHFWHRATVIKPLAADECSVENSLVPGTLVASLTPGGEPLTPDVDYILDEVNANIGWKEGGKIGPGTPVYLSYDYIPMRIDSVVYADHKMKLVPGAPHAVTPTPPALSEGETRLANVFVSSATQGRLTDENLYPILDDGVLHIPQKAVARKLLPKTWKKLHSGEPLKILAWGDSVTEAGYTSEENRWQSVFVRRLRERFPNADIELVSRGWGGRTSMDFLAAAPGSEHNFQEKVLDERPDLVVSEFVNDSSWSVEQLETVYPRLKKDFDAIGAEWIIVGPHYIRPNWMGLTSQKNIDDDPRPYTAYILRFGEENNVPVAETQVLYGRLWRQGIPDQTLMENNINHPNPYGLSLFGDALMALFGKE